jgi:hypothetical protein
LQVIPVFDRRKRTPVRITALLTAVLAFVPLGHVAATDRIFGHYDNRAQGLSVWIPDGLVASRIADDTCESGVKVFLDPDDFARIDIFAIQKDPAWSTPEDGARSLTNCTPGSLQPCRASRIVQATLGSLPAATAIKHEADYVSEVVLAVDPGQMLAYCAWLQTKRHRYEHDRRLFWAVVSTMRVGHPHPPWRCRTTG